MSYYIVYNPELGNALVGVTEEVPAIIPPGLAVKGHSGEFPDLTRMAYNPATLDFYHRPDVAITKLKFIKKFTAEEYATIKAAAAANAVVDYYWQLFMLAEDIVLSDPDTVSGVQALEQLGLLGAGRATEILG